MAESGKIDWAGHANDAKANIGDVMTFADAMAEEPTKNEETAFLYGGYNPLSVTLTHILNNKAGIGWTSYSHTGVPVPVYATVKGAKLFNGAYDNTEVYEKLVEIIELN